MRRSRRSCFARRHRLKLTIERILGWADEWFERTGRWPNTVSRSIPGTFGEETWHNLDSNLRTATRGLQFRTTLPLLLADHRGVRNRILRPPLTIERILGWADDWFARNGEWPHVASGMIPGTSGDEKWGNIDESLRSGGRGLDGGTSLAQLLTQCRGVRNPQDLPRLTISQVLAWADAHHLRTGEWPDVRCSAVADAPEETWLAVGRALEDGLRGFPGGTTLAQLLSDYRGVRNIGGLPPLTEEKILAWADAHHRRTGQWPRRKSGPIADAPGEIWSAVDTDLRNGLRGLEEGSSLARLLDRHRGVRNSRELPPLTEEQILAWADSRYERTGRWPAQQSGRLADEPTITWLAINCALSEGLRGLPGGSSLARLLRKHGRKPTTVQMHNVKASSCQSAK